jgi:hypothetical protein
MPLGKKREGSGCAVETIEEELQYLKTMCGALYTGHVLPTLWCEQL